MTLSFTETHYESSLLVEITFPAATFRYYMSVGFVSYGGHNWVNCDDVQGQILACSAFEDSLDALPNNDITISWGDGTIHGYALAGSHELATVKIYEAQRDLSTYALSVDTAYRQYYIQEVSEAIAGESIVFVLGKGIQKHDAGVLSSAYRSTLHSLTDNAFDYISGVQSV